MKLRKLLLVVWLLNVSESLSAQELYASERGIYLSFEEFLNNSPSRKDSFQIYEETILTIGRTSHISDNTVRGMRQTFFVYRLMDENGKRIKRVRDFWGFSDGFRLYINSNTKAGYFVKVQIIGPICYFFQAGNESGLKKVQYYDPGDIRQFYRHPEPKMYNLEQYILNMETGQINKLTKKLLLQIVRPHDDLVETVQTLHNEDYFMDIIVEYNYRVSNKGK